MNSFQRTACQQKNRLFLKDLNICTRKFRTGIVYEHDCLEVILKPDILFHHGERSQGKRCHILVKEDGSLHLGLCCILLGHHLWSSKVHEEQGSPTPETGPCCLVSIPSSVQHHRNHQADTREIPYCTNSWMDLFCVYHGISFRTSWILDFFICFVQNIWIWGHCFYCFEKTETNIPSLVSSCCCDDLCILCHSLGTTIWKMVRDDKLCCSCDNVQLLHPESLEDPSAENCSHDDNCHSDCTSKFFWSRINW